MSHPDPLYDPDNSYDEDVDMDFDSNYDYASYDDGYYDDYNDFNEMVEDGADDFWYDEVDDSMDGDHDSAMGSVGWGVDEQYESNYDYDSDFNDW